MDKISNHINGNLPKLDSDGNLVDSGISVISFNNKVDKVSSATANNFATLDENGNLKDSGKNAASFATAAQGRKADTALQPAQTATGLLKNDGTVDTETAGKANSAVQPVTTATEDNFVAFDKDGNIKDSGAKSSDFIPMPFTGIDGQILEKDSNVTNGVKWSNKPSDGKSAYEIWYEENEYDDPITYNEDYFLASLKAQFGSFVPADYGTNGVPASDGSDITPSADTLNYIYLVNNDVNTPTAKTMWITVVNDSDPVTYDWTSIGNVQVDLTFGSGQ